MAAAVAALTLSGGAARAASTSPQWRLLSSANTSSTQENDLSGVSCVSSSFCMAVGTYFHASVAQTLIEKWNGSTWSLVSSPDSSTTQFNRLNSVSCRSTGFCIAAGYYYTGTNEQTLIEKWNGSTWSLVSSPNTSSTATNDLEGASCVSSSFCMAAGNYTGTHDQTLIEKWNGSTWSLVSSPNRSTTQDNDLSGVSCWSTSFCMAAASYYTGTIYQTLIEKWNGSTWSLVSSANTSSTQNNFLNGVSCRSTSFCMAAGDYSTGTYRQTLIEKWNGST